MTNSPNWYDASVIAAVNALTALLNSGYLEIWSGTQPAEDGSLTGTKLAKLALSSTAFATATAASGTVTATANTITSANALATGTAGYFALMKSDDTTVVMTGSVGHQRGGPQPVVPVDRLGRQRLLLWLHDH